MFRINHLPKVSLSYRAHFLITKIKDKPIMPNVVKRIDALVMCLNLR